jgi:hypothetical protein
MLTELCQELRNWFERKKFYGTFTIENGQITVPDGSLQNGQYFRIIGSVFNDGVHKYEPESESAETLADEVFEGAIWSMAVPPSVVDLSERISEWVTKYGDSVSSPYSSESFGGYSYQKASSGQGNAGSSSPTWQSTFASELNRWRKI